MGHFLTHSQTASRAWRLINSTSFVGFRALEHFLPIQYSKPNPLHLQALNPQHSSLNFTTCIFNSISYPSVLKYRVLVKLWFQSSFQSQRVVIASRKLPLGLWEETRARRGLFARLGVVNGVDLGPERRSVSGTVSEARGIERGLRGGLGPGCGCRTSLNSGVDEFVVCNCLFP